MDKRLQPLGGGGVGGQTTWPCLSQLKMHVASAPATPVPGTFPTEMFPKVPSEVWTRIFVGGIV